MYYIRCAWHRPIHGYPTGAADPADWLFARDDDTRASAEHRANHLNRQEAQYADPVHFYVTDIDRPNRNAEWMNQP